MVVPLLLFSNERTEMNKVWARPGHIAAALMLSVVGAGSAGCGGDRAGGLDGKLAAGARPTTIDHEQCETKGRVEQLDTNNDGKVDIKRVYDSAGKEICRGTDFSRDGKPDFYEYYDATGQVRRREADYDDNGVANRVEYLEGGKLVRVELDTTNHGKLDTWDFYDASTGKRTKRERDSNGDGKIDQWWVWDGDNITIQNDHDNDGQPDPNATVVYGPNGIVKQPVAAPPAATEDAGAPAPAAPPPTAPAPAPSAAPAPVAADGGAK